MELATINTTMYAKGELIIKIYKKCIDEELLIMYPQLFYHCKHARHNGEYINTMADYILCVKKYVNERSFQEHVAPIINNEQITMNKSGHNATMIIYSQYLATGPNMLHLNENDCIQLIKDIIGFQLEIHLLKNISVNANHCDIKSRYSDPKISICISNLNQKKRNCAEKTCKHVHKRVKTSE